MLSFRKILRGLSGLEHVLLGSIAERVLRIAHCPLPTVKAAAKG